MTNLAILWSFRRCPYAMRARLAIVSSQLEVELREIELKAKPEEFLATSQSGTVPALKDGDLIIDESLDIMLWALEKSDPENLLDMPQQAWELIRANDGPFKSALDHTKYSVRFPHLDIEAERAKASEFLLSLEELLSNHNWLFGAKPTLADFAIAPFVRQFANTDIDWFKAQDWPCLITWLETFKNSKRFEAVMHKYAPWQEQSDAFIFGKS